MSSTLTAPRNDTTTATTETTEPIRTGMTTRTLRAFFALAFGLGWGIAALMVVFQDQVEAIFGEIGMTNPVFLLVVYSPAMAGIILVWRHYGREGLRSYFRRVTLWRMPRAWWAFLIVGIPAIVYTGAAIKGTATEFHFSPWYGMFGALAITLIIGPVEEFGWRGVALPLLQRRFAPLWSALILGGFWGLWHAPAFLLSGTKQASWSFPAFVIGVLALAVIVTPMFNAAQGSILIAGLFHFQVNGPVWPDAQPWDTLVYVAAAILVVVLNRKTMLTRGSGVTDVLMQGDEERLRLPA
jgi:membrane protease YdiL (CAAX protease family)